MESTRTRVLAALLLGLAALGWAVAPLPVPLTQRGPLLFDEGAMLEEALELARPGTYQDAPPGTRYDSGRPVFIAGVALAIRALGPRPWSAALVNAVAAAGALLAIALVGRRGGWRLAVLAPIALASSNLFLQLSRSSLAEPLPVLFLVLALAAMLSRESGLAGAAFAGALLANPRFLLAAPLVIACAPWDRTAVRALGRCALGGAIALAAGGVLLRAATGGALDPLASAGALFRTNREFLQAGSALDYPVFALAVEGPVFACLALIGVTLGFRAGGERRQLAVGLLVALAALTFGYAHHELRYLSLALPGLALAVAWTLESLMDAGIASRAGRAGPAAIAALALIAAALTRPSLPGGDVRQYQAALASLPADHPVLATNYPVLRYLAKCAGRAAPVFPTVRSPATLTRLAQPAGAEVLLDFERHFLARWWAGEHAEVCEDWLRQHVAPRTLSLPASWPLYIRLEHGLESETPEVGDLGRVYWFSVPAQGRME